ncbi:MAG: hypothetical protein ACQESF_00480 [Nanobdellota archaeon]
MKKKSFNFKLKKYHVLLAIVAYIFLSLIFFFPLLDNFNTHLYGPPEDNMEFVWCLWHVKQAVTGNSSLYTSDMIFYPEGHSVLLESVSWFNAFFAVPLQLVFSLPTVYNILILLGFILSGVGAYLLAYYFSKCRLVSFVGGFIYAFCPYHITASLHHLNVASMQFLPFFVLFYFKYMKEKKLFHLFLAVLFFVLSSLCSWYFFIILSIFIGAEYIFHSIFAKKFDLHRFSRVILIILISLMLLSPLLIPMVKVYFDHSERLDSSMKQGHSQDVADLYGFVTPLPPLSMYDFTDKEFRTSGCYDEVHVFLGFTNIALLIYLIFSRLKKIKKLLMIFFLFALLSMGNFLKINDVGFEKIKLPFSLIHYIPIVNVPSAPGTMIVMSYLMLAVLVSLSLKSIINSAKNFSLVYKYGIFLILCSFIIFEFYGVTDLMTPYVSEDIYNEIPGPDGGVVNLPILYCGPENILISNPYDFRIKNPELYNGFSINKRAQLLSDQYYMMLQTNHGVPIFNGCLSRMFGGPNRKYFKDLKDADKIRAFSYQNNISHFVLHKGYYNDNKVRFLNKNFQKISENKNCILYKVI